MIATHMDYRLGLFGLVHHNPLCYDLQFYDWNMLYKLCFCAIKMVLLFIKVRYIIKSYKGPTFGNRKGARTM